MEKIQGFVAYPSSPAQLAVAVRSAIEIADGNKNCSYSGWEENDVAGRPLTAPIFRNIENSNILVADVTILNFNVSYEIGYAIGFGRRVFLVRNQEFEADDKKITSVGIFDTLGCQTYANSAELAKHITSITDVTPLEIVSGLNRAAPVYLLETPVRGGITTHIVSRVKKARLQYRSFKPSEEPRMAAMDAVTHIASSFGVLVPLLSEDMFGHEIHNIRAAFVAGLSHGMRKPTLILQDHSGPVPLDIRDFVKRFSRPEDITDHIHN